jgi:pimeloyl-ACP methyl ester carboxylesterase
VPAGRRVDDVDDECDARAGLDVAELLRRTHPHAADVDRVIGAHEVRDRRVADNTIGRHRCQTTEPLAGEPCPLVWTEARADHRDDGSSPQRGNEPSVAYAFDAYQRVYGASDPSVALGSILTPAGQAAVPKIVPLCLLTHIDKLHAIADPVIGKFLAADPSKTEPWATLLAQNTPGGARVGVPMLVTQGDTDALVKPATTAQYVATLCTNGEHVEFRTYADIDHGLIAERTVPLLIPWFAALVAGQPRAGTCP